MRQKRVPASGATRLRIETLTVSPVTSSMLKLQPYYYNIQLVHYYFTIYYTIGFRKSSSLSLSLSLKLISVSTAKR